MIILLLSLAIQITLSLKKASYGLMTYMAIRLCIPSAARVGSFSFNTLALMMLLICTPPTLIKRYFRIDKIDKYYINNIIYLIVVLYVLTLFANYVPFSFQIKALIQMCSTELLPSIIFIILIKDQIDIKRCVTVLMYCSIFTSLYGIFTFLTRSNPLYDLFQTEGNLFENEFSRAGIESMAVGIYNDSIFLSLVCLLLITFLYNKSSIIKNKKLWGFTILILTINLILTTKRSGLIALIIFGIILFFDKQYRKVLKKILICGIIAVILLSFLPQGEGIKDMIISVIFFWNDKVQDSLDIGGSSNDLRLRQLLAVLDLVKYNILQGMGYDFANYYYTEIYDASIYGLDPDFAGFESFAFKILSASGIIGFIMWIKTFYNIKKYIHYKNNTSKYYALAFVASYLFAILITDTSGSFYLFFILSVLNKKFLMINNSNNQTKIEL